MWFPTFLLVIETATTMAVPVAPAESLAVTIQGRGDPVVLIPGLFGAAFGYRNLTPLLIEQGHQVVIVEPLGVGSSARPAKADYSLTQQAFRVAAALDTLGVKNALIVAHSVSAAIAMRLAIERPDLVRGLISIEGGPAEEATTASFRLAMKFAPLIKLFGGKGMVRGELHKRLIASSGDGSWVTDEIVEGYTAGATRDVGATIDVFKAMAKASEPWPLGKTLDRIRCPLRLVVGLAPHTSGVPEPQVEALKTAVTDFSIHQVEGAGHFIFEEQPAAIADVIAEFEKGRGASATLTALRHPQFRYVH